MIKIIKNNRPAGTHPFASAKNPVNKKVPETPAKMGIADAWELPPPDKNLPDSFIFPHFFDYF